MAPRCESSDVAWGWRRVRLEVGHDGEPVQPGGARGLSGVTSRSQRGRWEGLGLSMGTLSRLSPQVSIQEHVLTGLVDQAEGHLEPPLAGVWGSGECSAAL